MGLAVTVGDSVSPPVGLELNDGGDVGVELGSAVILLKGIKEQSLNSANVMHSTIQFLGSWKQTESGLVSCAKRGPPSGQT